MVSQALQHPVRAVAFDYGNTLIQFNRQQLDGIIDRITSAFGPGVPVSRESVADCLGRMRREPYDNGFHEVPWLIQMERLVREVTGQPASPVQLRALDRAHRETFVASIQLEPEVLSTLEALAKRTTLALLSNYPCSASIHESLRSLGLTSCFRQVLVSEDLGVVKPHPRAFSALVDALVVRPEEVLFVGDNWVADVQGALRAGLQVAHFRRWSPPEIHERSATDLEPQLELRDLRELLDLPLARPATLRPSAPTESRRGVA